jgi:peptide subunit release factor 1 (eRF1)
MISLLLPPGGQVSPALDVDLHTSEPARDARSRPTPPRLQISRTNAMLTEEYGTAQNIKSRVNR